MLLCTQLNLENLSRAPELVVRLMRQLHHNDLLYENATLLRLILLIGGTSREIVVKEHKQLTEEVVKY